VHLTLAGIKISDFASDSQLEIDTISDGHLNIGLAISALAKLMVLKSLIVFLGDVDGCDSDYFLFSVFSNQVEKDTALLDMV
jgi:hypothetical protein